MIQPYNADGPTEADAGRRREAAPVFADASGQRRRLMRVLGAVASVLMVGALIMAASGLFGGPDTPFSVFGSPSAQRHDQHGASGHSGKGGGTAPGSATRSGLVSPSGSAPSPSGSASPSPSASGRSPAPTQSISPVPTNKAGRTPPGLSRTKRPHPSPSSHGR
ncbi:MAG TPA: hypothetical protein VFQ44_25055 [Streptosporangiaceae bacterium]|nr:hypothetical protein [Streptosporangiaceae bacterium]